MPKGKTSLADLRQEIDEIDTAIHDLLMRRTETAREIGAAKGDSTSYIRPGREASILRRIIQRHKGPFPKPVLVHLWREIFAAVTAVQGKFAVAVYAPEGRFGFRNLARDHYGSQTPITAYRSAAQVLQEVTEGQATIGVLPIPEVEDRDPWWRNLASDGKTPRIIARLPFIEPAGSRSEGAEGLVVGMAPQEETGHDRSFLVIETDTEVSRSRLKTLFGQVGCEAVELLLWSELPERWLYLVEIEGYLSPEDDRRDHLIEGSQGAVHQIWAVGGYALPLTQEELAPAG